MKDSAKKKDENVKEEKKEATASINGPSFNKDSIKETKDVKEQKETPVKEVKEVVKETTVLSAQPPAKESKKSKKKNDILAQIGKLIY